MIILIGPSAVGKTEIAKELNRLYNIKKIITHTTREKRIGEVDGIDYYFVSKEKFLALKEQDFFVETTFYNNNYYGTSKNEIQDNKVLVVDPNGKELFLKLQNHNIVVFYIDANENIRKQRMNNRGDSSESIKQRLSRDKICFNDDARKDVNFIIINENKTLEEIAKEIYSKYKSVK